MSSKYPIARIDYLHTDGSIGESCHYYTESEFLGRVKEDNYYGTPMVVNIYRDENGETIPLDFVEDFDPPPQGFNIIDFTEDNDMNEFDKLRKMAERFKSMYPTGTRIELQHMGSDPHPIPDGTRGTVKAVDDIGTIHCDFDNGRHLGIVPGEDSFRLLTPDELLDEKSIKMQDEFIGKVNDEVIPAIDRKVMQDAYAAGNMSVTTEILRSLHEKFLEVYGDAHLERDLGFVCVPGIVQAADGKLYPALLEIDTQSSGEHWGTNFFTPNGVLSDHSEDRIIQREIQKLVPYEYWYTVELDSDHHVNWENCPAEVQEILDAAADHGTIHEVKLE